MKALYPVCPFCGHSSLMLDCRMDDCTTVTFWYFVQCQRCRARGPETETPEAAVRFWGVRYAPLVKATLDGSLTSELVTPMKTGERPHA